MDKSTPSNNSRIQRRRNERSMRRDILEIRKLMRNIDKEEEQKKIEHYKQLLKDIGELEEPFKEPEEKKSS